MKFKFIFFALLFCCALSPLAAQQYMVAHAGAETEYYSGDEWKPISRRDMLDADGMIRLGKNTSLTLIDVRSEEMYSYGRQGETTVANAVKKSKTSVLRRFVAYMADAVRNGDADRISHTATVIYRDTNADGTVYAAFKDAAHKSGFLLGLELVDPQSREPLGRELTLGQRFVFRVYNHSDEALFVNVVGIDSDGEMFDCLPVDPAMTMTHLLVPAGCTVDFTGYPLELSYPAGEQQFVLLAAEMPFDVRRVIALAGENAAVSASQQPVGKFKTTVILQ